MSFGLVWRPNTLRVPIRAFAILSRLHLQRRRGPCRISISHRTRTTQTRSHITATRHTRRTSLVRRTTRRPHSRSIHFHIILHAHHAPPNCPTLLYLAPTYTALRYTTVQLAAIMEITKASREGVRRLSFEKFTTRSVRLSSNSRKRI